MSRSRWLLGAFLAANGCAETVGTSPVDGPVGGFDAAVVSVLPPTDDRTSPDASPLPDLGPCRAIFLPARALGLADVIYEAVRADGDNTAVFWSQSSGSGVPSVMLQRFNAVGDAVDSQPIALASVAPTTVQQVTTAWDHAANEPALLMMETPGTATLRVGGLHGEPTVRTIALRDAPAGSDLTLAHGLRAADDGWTFVARTSGASIAIVLLSVSARGDLRAAHTLRANGHFNHPYSTFVELLDGSAVLVSSADVRGAYDHRRLDAHGEFIGPAATWPVSVRPLWPPIAPTRTGYLLGTSRTGSGSVSVAAFGWDGAALSPAHESALPAIHTPTAMFSAHGQAFVVVTDIERLPGRTYLQPVTGAGTVGAPIPMESQAGPAYETQMVPTSIGALAVYGTIGGPPGYGLWIAPLRVCD
jgi:hypothetical protein